MTVFTPAKWASGTWDTFRWGVTKPYRLPSTKDVTLQRHPAFTESTIQVHIRALSPTEMEIYSGGSLNEVLRMAITQAGIQPNDRLYDLDQEAYYEVQLVQDHHDGASFAYRTALIKKLLPS